MVSNTENKGRRKFSHKNEIWRRYKKNKLAVGGLIVFIALLIIAALAPYIAPYGIDDQDYTCIMQKPSKEHWFGTDKLGRDLFTRVLMGSRVSLFVGVLTVGIGLLIGATLGIIAGYFGKSVDMVIMRGFDVVRAIPGLILAVVISAALGPGLFNTMIACGAMVMPNYAIVARAAVMTVKESEFIEASRAIGAKTPRMILKHIIPNSLSPIIIQTSQGLAGAILMISMLSFIGLGVQPPTPEWGALLSEGRAYIRDYAYLSVFPGLAIMATVFSINLIGDGLRDALDPKLKR